MKYLPLPFLCFMSLTALATIQPPLVLFDGQQPISGWKINTPVTGIIKHSAENELRFTVQSWKEGMDGWPRLNLDGSLLDLSGYSQIHVELENPTDQWEDVCLGTHSHSSREQRSVVTGNLEPHSRRTFVLDISDGVNMDPSAINHLSFYLIFPKKEQTYILRKIEAVWNPNYVSTNEAAKERFRGAKQQVEKAKVKDQKAIDLAQKQLDRSEKALAERKPGYINYVKPLLEQVESDISRAALVERDIPFLVWNSPLAQPMRNITLPPFDATALEKLHQRIALNDYKAICINISAASTAQSVSVELENSHQGIFALKPTYLVIARDGTETADAIGLVTPSLNMEIPAFETRQFIVWIDTKTNPPQPGEYHATIQIKSGDKVQTIPLTLEVANLRLPDHIPLLTYNWAYFFVTQVSVTEGLEKEAVSNLRDYGINSWVIRYQQVPLPKLDSQGQYLGLDNTEVFHKVMSLINIRPYENLILWLELKRSEVADLFKNQEVVNAYYRDLRVLLDKYGVAADRRYIHFTDEPKLDLAKQGLEWMEMAHKADPTIKFFDNGSSPLEEKESRERFLKLVDVYSPDWDYGFVAMHRDGMDVYIEKLQGEGVKNLGFYRCRMARKNHGINIYEYYRLNFWRLARYGMGNVGFWVYNAGHGEDEWDGRKGAGSGGTVVYRRDDKLLTSRRWELFREGLSDYRLLLALTGEDGVLHLKEHPQFLPIAKTLLQDVDQLSAADDIYQRLLKEKSP